MHVKQISRLGKRVMKAYISKTKYEDELLRVSLGEGQFKQINLPHKGYEIFHNNKFSIKDFEQWSSFHLSAQSTCMCLGLPLLLISRRILHHLLIPKAVLSLSHDGKYFLILHNGYNNVFTFVEVLSQLFFSKSCHCDYPK